MLLTEALPALASELELLLKEQGELELAARVSHAVIIDRCRCGDDFCSSFYTQPKPEGSYGPGHRCVDLKPADGMLVLDVVADTIFHVEVLYRGDVRKQLFALLP